MYQRLHEQHAREADERRAANRKVVDRLAMFHRPRSLLDVGCSLGYLIEAACEVFPGLEITGVDGPWTDKSQLRFPAERFVVADLGQPLDLGRRYDLVVSLEVAEHIDPKHADTFVASLVRHGELILFSAAIPAQGGSGHVNEQHLGYWGERFARHGYLGVDLMREAFWGDARVFPWFRQNLMVFASEAFLAQHSWAKARQVDDPARLSVVHPIYYDAKLRALQITRTRLEQVTTILSQPLPYLRQVDRAVEARLRDGREVEPSVFAPLKVDPLKLDQEATSLVTAFCDRQGCLSISSYIAGRKLTEGAPSVTAVLLQAERLEAMGAAVEAETLVRAAFDREPDVRLAERLARYDLEALRLDEAQAWSPRLRPKAVSRLQRDLQELRQLRHSGSFVAGGGRVFIVSLRSERYRRRACLARLDRLGVEATVVDALRPDAAPPELQRLLPSAEVSDGSYGNQLTQYLLWKRIAADPAIEWALILEDDAFLRAAPPNIARLRRVGSAELIFANDRLARAAAPHDRRRPQLEPLVETLERLSRDQSNADAPGSDAYFISRSGAAKLAQAVERMGLTQVGTDWLLLSHGVSEEDVQRLGEGFARTQLAHRLDVKRKSGVTLRLDARVLSPCLAIHRSYGLNRRHRTLD